MPIVSRALTMLANREDIGPGIKRWRVDGVDGQQRGWMHGPFFGTQAEAEITRDELTNVGKSWDTEALAQTDERDLLIWVQERNTVASFDYANRDIDEARGEEFIFQWFAESPGGDAITVAWWMDSITTGNFNSIRDRIGYTGAEGADITSRFTFMVAVEPWHEFTIEAP